MIPSSLKKLVLARVEQCYQRAEQQLNTQFPRPQITFDQRGKSAGSARLQTNHIRLNPVLLTDNQDVFLEEVIPHEISHLLAFQLHGRVKPHGPQWQYLMRQVFGVSAQTRHTMDVTKVEGKTYPYQCGCGQVSLSVRRHNNVIRHKQIYVCRKCNQQLVFAD